MKLLMDINFHIKDKKKSSDEMDHKAHAKHSEVIGEHAVQTCHGGLTGTGNQSQQCIHDKSSWFMFISFILSLKFKYATKAEKTQEYLKKLFKKVSIFKKRGGNFSDNIVKYFYESRQYLQIVYIDRI